MKHYYIYWAPEVVLGKALCTGSDIWSLGVMTYLLLTGDYPFTIEQEDQTVKNILNANINWRPLNTYPKAINMLGNIFQIEPEKRWSAQQILAFCQDEFAIVIQRFWRGHL